MKRITLQPRVHLNVMPFSKFKTNYVCIELCMPLRAETAPLYTLIPQVLDRGCAAYPDLPTLARRTEEIYGTGIGVTSYKSGEGQNIALYAYPLDNAYAIDGMDILGQTVTLMGQMLLEPKLDGGLFDASYVESEKQVLIDAIRAEINNKTGFAYQQMIREMCKDEPYGISLRGTEAQVKAITPETLTAAYRDVLKQAKIEIWALGNMEEAALIRAFSRILAALPAGEAANAPIQVKRRAEGEGKTKVEALPMKQGKLVMGFRSGRVLADGEAVFTPFNVFQTLYGAGTTSKLCMNVREKLSLCYYCSASSDALKGIMTVQSGIEEQNFDQAKDEILAQLAAVQAGDFTEEELESAKECLINRYREIEDELGSMKGWYATRLAAGRSDSPADAIAAVKRVTREDVIAAAKDVTLDTVYFLHGDGTVEDEGEEEEA